ncbi:unnamed protein product [Prorocentrum cordatum]|uniref:Uncharacterized protein n=1 Tax=Prorocentrum cordatum TaxID=2364126 RepID=A0ABN9X868_9DINO|nr:unnamed protein product [Polarella glacialis]
MVTFHPWRWMRTTCCLTRRMCTIFRSPTSPAPKSHRTIFVSRRAIRSRVFLGGMGKRVDEAQLQHRPLAKAVRRRLRGKQVQRQRLLGQHLCRDRRGLRRALTRVGGRGGPCALRERALLQAMEPPFPPGAAGVDISLSLADSQSRLPHTYSSHLEEVLAVQTGTSLPVISITRHIST